MCSLAALPMMTLGQTTTLPTRRYEEMLRHCTAALEACWQLYRSNDIQGRRHAFECVSTYIPIPDAASSPPQTCRLWLPHTPALHDFIASNITCQIFQIAHTDYDILDEMRAAIQAAIKDMNTMGDEITRRDVLCQLASIPMIALGAKHTLKASRYEEMLRFCTAALEGCWELYRGSDISGAKHAFECVCTYVPMLETIARDSASLKRQALDLAARYAILRTLLSWTLASPVEEAVRSARHAVSLSDEAGDILLRISARTKLNWTLLRNKHYTQGLETMQECGQVLKNYKGPVLPSGMTGNVQSSYALAQVHSGLDPDVALGIALDSEPLSCHIALVEFTEADQHWEAAKIYSLKGDPVGAMDQFRKLISTETFALLPGVGLTEEDRPHAVNHLVEAMLQLPERDKEHIVRAWTIAMMGAQERHDDVMYDDAMANFAIMRNLWHGEQAIRQLIPLTSHW
jgi:hypothetical protein